MKNIFRIVLSVVVFIVTYISVGIVTNILLVLSTGIPDPTDAAFAVGYENPILGLSMLLMLFAIPAFTAITFYRSNLLRKK